MLSLVSIGMVVLSSTLGRVQITIGDVVAWWKFDEQKGNVAIDSIPTLSGSLMDGKFIRKSDTIRGNFEYVEGVTGKAIKFDGYTTSITRKAGKVPKLTDAFSIEAWVALQSYPWNWTAIVDQQGPVVSAHKAAGPEQVSDEQLRPGLVGVRYESPDLTRPDEDDTLTKADNDWTGQGNDWSARWRGYIKAPFTGLVTFEAEANNGVKLVIAGKMVIDGWGKDKARSGTIAMAKGENYPVELSYFQDGGDSMLKLYWSWDGQGKGLVTASVLGHSQSQAELARSERRGEQKPKASKTHIFLGIDATGHVGLKLNLNARLYECSSINKLELLKWAHVVATFDEDEGIAIYVNGAKVGEGATEGKLQGEGLSDLLIGKSHQKASPVGTERDASRKTMSNMVLDGLVDEVKIYGRALSGEQVVEAFESSKPQNEQPLRFRKMPSGPKELPKRFTAYYTRLRYDELWEKPWRVAEHPDILVTFDNSPVRVVFWRGTNYGASWVTENDIWMGDQSLEDSGTGWGLSEHMADKQNRYSHVRLIENHEARIVVHWRYAVADIRYTINHTDEETGWGDWVDEYYYIYPDAVAIRKQVLWTGSNVGGFQWQETLFFGQPGTRPEDNIEIEAFTLANMDGQTHTYSYAEGAPDDYPEPKGANIQMTNLKAKNRPFIIFQPTSEIKAFGSGSESSNFPWWNHWPVSMIPSDGRKASAADRAFHASLSNYRPRAAKGRGDSYIAASLYGMTDKGIEAVLPLAKSWIHPAKIWVSESGGESWDELVWAGYDKRQRAYVVSWPREFMPIRLSLRANEQSPVVNPAFVVKNWGPGAAVLEIDGREVKRGPEFRFGHRRTLDGTDLIVWIGVESTKAISISLRPAGNREEILP